MGARLNLCNIERVKTQLIISHWAKVGHFDTVCMCQNPLPQERERFLRYPSVRCQQWDIVHMRTRLRDIRKNLALVLGFWATTSGNPLSFSHFLLYFFHLVLKQIQYFDTCQYFYKLINLFCMHTLIQSNRYLFTPKLPLSPHPSLHPLHSPGQNSAFLGNISLSSLTKDDISSKTPSCFPSPVDSQRQPALWPPESDRQSPALQ